MRVLVTGGCGMLGREVIAALDGKHQVIPTDVLPGCEALDITDTNVVFDAINRFRPDMVIHCAAMTNVDGCERDPDSAYKINAVGTWNLACACASIDCAIAYVSTDYVFDGEAGRSYSEFDTDQPDGRLRGQQACRRDRR